MGQREEIETIKERNITLKLSDADVKRICEKAGSVSLTLSDLLENFIGDLVDGTYTNGSDERMYANEWFDRCWFGMFPEHTFLSFLIERDDVEDTLDDWEEITYFKELEELDDNDKGDLAYFEEQINDKFREFLSCKRDGEKETSLTEEMKKVIEYWEQYKHML